MGDERIRNAELTESTGRFRWGTIRARLLLAFVTVVLLPVIAITIESVVTSAQSRYAQVIDQFDSVASLKEASIVDWLERLQMNLRVELDTAPSLASTLLQTRPDTAGYRTAYETQKQRFEQTIRQRQRFDELFLMNSRGEIILSTRPANESRDRSTQPYFQGGLQRPGAYVSVSPASSTSERTATVVIVRPVVDAQGHTLGVVAGQANLGFLEQLMSQRIGLGGSGETYLVSPDGMLLTPSRFPDAAPAATRVRSVGIDAAIEKHSSGSGPYDDYRGVAVLGVYRWLPDLQVALLAEEDRAEALRPLYTTLALNGVVAVAAILIAIVVSVLIANSIARPVATLAQTAEQIAEGDLELTAPVEQPHEIATLAQAFNSMTAQLRTLIAGLEQRLADLKRTSRELEESEAKYRRIVDTASEGIWVIGLDGIVTFVNSRMAVMLGRSPKEVIGHPATDFLFAGDVPDHLRALEDRRRGMPGAYERRLRREDGQAVWTSVSATPIFGEGHRFEGSIAMLTDITERRLAEEELRVSRQKLARHIEQTLLGVIEWDPEFRVREWNPAAEAIFGYSRDEAIGRHAAELILPEANRAELDSVFRQLLQQEGGEFNTNENVTKDGRTIVCEWVNTPVLGDDGAVVGIMSLARDVTERKEAERLRIAMEAAEAASLAKSTFLANMSHEIRTPMNAILGFAQLMRHDKGLSQRQRQQLDIINSSGEHLLALVNDILEMSKVEAGRTTVNPSAFNLRTLLNELDSMFGLRAQAKGLELRVIGSNEVPPFIVTDENKLRQVLVNLLGNAVKFTSEGSVELRVSTSRNEAGELRLHAEVQDTGPGIAPQDTERLFKYFEQAAAGGEAQAGTGLGLAISQEFVRLLGGEISVDSQPGTGSIFWFEIAIEEAAAEDVATIADERRVVSLSQGEPQYRILVVDDAPDNRELLAQLLEPVGFDVRTVADGQDAVRESEKWRPQLILMDMRMPVMDGYEATRRIRKTELGAHVAIIGVTASVFSEMRQGVYDAGVDDFIAKPFGPGELFGKIGKLLGAHYVYEDEGESTERKIAEGLDAEAIAALPSELVSRLERATLAADFETVLQLADEAERHSDRAGAALRALAERFDAERIVEALSGGEDA
jgi:PAS domain S-box-containing protein